MNIEEARVKLSTQLSNYFEVRTVRAFYADTDKARGSAMRHAGVVGFEIILERGVRYITFALEKDGRWLFTRAKEGISNNIFADTREKDFWFQLSDDVENRNSVVGRFVEQHINSIAMGTVKDIIASSAQKYGFNGFYTSGYKITNTNKDRMTFDAIAEVLVATSDGDYDRFDLVFTNNELVRVANSSGYELSMREVFSRALPYF